MLTRSSPWVRSEFTLRGSAASSGFTLLEMMVVLAVIGIALAVAAPSLPRPRTGDDAAAHAVVRLLEQARRKAAEEGRATAVRLDFETGTFQVFIERRITEPHTLMRDSLLGQGSLAVRRPEQMQKVIWFDPLGRAGGGPVWIGDPAGGMAVEVAPWTGGPHVTR